MKRVGSAREGRSHRRSDLLAVLLERTDAHVGLLQELVGEETCVVRLVDPSDGKCDRRLAPRAVLAGRVRLRLRSEEHTSELQSHVNLVCRLLLEKKKR